MTRLRLDLYVAAEDADEVWPVYAAVWPETDAASWRTEVWERHAGREGFRLVRAHDDERLVGFAYGYTGQPGQWWSDRVVTTLPVEVGQEWLGGHFEVVSVGVLAVARGRGLGGRLMSELSAVEHDRLLLQTTADPQDPARRLYDRLGWTVLGPGAGTGTVVLGRQR